MPTPNTLINTVNSLPTPALLLDKIALERNIQTMQERMAQLGVTLRPHLKTAKSATIAHLATAGQAGGITVSTLREAGYFFEHGLRDLLYAVGIAPGKLEAVDALTRRGADMKIITDNDTAARAIGDYARSHDASFKVMIEIDSGGRRAGVLPDSDALLSIGHILQQAPGVELIGVLTHAGHSYHCDAADAIQEVARQERDAIVLAAERLRAAGLPCPVVSAGSTPTACLAEDLSGVTEMRPGVFVFYDLDQLAIGVCQRQDLALSVLASVIGHNRHAGHLILDAGALALSKDISAQEFRTEVGYGELCDSTTQAVLPGLYVQSVSQEHGLVPVSDPDWYDRLPVGAKVRILPNHACITAAAYDCYQVLEGDEVIAQWDRVNGW
ncbi:MAG: alanine racemase [Gammaproteobacteria bacterium]